MKQQIVCVVARQRSGTTALRANLTATGRLHNFGEIFHTDNLDKPGSFLGYCANHRILLSDACAPRALAELCAAYLAHLREIAQDKHVLIDVKFNSWGVVRPAWRYLHEEPYFLHFLKKQDALFLFIRREDIAAQIVSSHIAKAHDQWQNLEAGDAVAMADVNVKKAKREARLIRQSETFLWSGLKNYGRRILFTYEQLFVDGNLANAAKEEITMALGEALDFPLESPIRKGEIDKATGVKNYAEASRAIAQAAEKVARRKRT
jgi:LPS sulfotransferase NodH